MVLQFGKGQEVVDLLFLHSDHPGQPVEQAIPTRARGSQRGRSLPSEEECDVKCGTVQIDKLKKKHFQGEAVLPLGFCARLFCGQKGAVFERLNMNPALPLALPSPPHSLRGSSGGTGGSSLLTVDRLCSRPCRG